MRKVIFLTMLLVAAKVTMAVADQQWRLYNSRLDRIFW